MNTVIPPVIHLPIQFKELICNQLAADLSGLGRILAALRSEPASSSRLGAIVGTAAPTRTSPTFEIVPAEYGHNRRFDQKTRRAQILAKRDASVAQARQKLIGLMCPKPLLSPSDSFHGSSYPTVARIAEAGKTDAAVTTNLIAGRVRTLADASIADASRLDKKSVAFLKQHSNAYAILDGGKCVATGLFNLAKMTFDEGILKTLDELREAKTQSAKKAARKKRKKFVTVPSVDLLADKKTYEARSSQARLEELSRSFAAEVRDWQAVSTSLKKQTLKEYAVQVSSRPAFPHSHNMPRIRKNFCPHCAEVVTEGNSVLRETKGLYLAIEHECPKVHVVEAVPTFAHKSVVVRPYEFPSEEAAQNHFESKLVTFVGDGAELEVIDSFKYNPRANHSDQREKDLMGWAQRKSPAGVVVGSACLRCNAPFTKRKGTKYCSENCKKRQWEETNTQGDN